MESNLSELAILSVFESFDRYAKTELIHKLIDISRDTYFEKFDDDRYEPIMRFRDIRINANQKRRPTSTNYIREIDARIWHVIFNSTKLVNIGGIPTFLFYEKQEDLEFFKTEINHNGLPMAQISKVKELDSGLISLNRFLIMFIQNKTVTDKILGRFVFDKIEDFNKELKEFKIPEFIYGPVHLDQDWVFLNILYLHQNGFKDKYTIAKTNWDWIKENTKAIILPNMHDQEFKIFLNATHVNPNRITHYNEDKNDFWSIYEYLGQAGLNHIYLCKYLSATEFNKINVKELLILHHETMLERLKPFL